MDQPGFRIPLLPEQELAAISRKELDIPYADGSPVQKLDLYFPPQGEGPFPLVIHIHGGAFLFGTKRDVNLRPMLKVLERGFALASIGYRLSEEARFPALVYDCKAAIRFLRANATQYGLCQDRFGVWGPSAGGYLAAMLGTTGGNPVFEDLSMGNPEQSSCVQVVVDWCGPAADFSRMDGQIRENRRGDADHDDPLSPESRLLGQPIQAAKELSRLAAPITHVHSHVPPFLIHHGEGDGIVPVQQSLDLAERIGQIAGPGRVEIKTFPGKGHHGEPWYEEPEMVDAVVAFLTRTLKGEGCS